MHFVDNLSPVLVHLGPLQIRWYGLMYVVGILIGIQAGLPYVRARGITDQDIDRMARRNPATLLGLKPQ